MVLEQEKNRYLRHVQANAELEDTYHHIQDRGPALIHKLARLPRQIVSNSAVCVKTQSSSNHHWLDRFFENCGIATRIRARPDTNRINSNKGIISDQPPPPTLVGNQGRRGLHRRVLVKIY